MTKSLNLPSMPTTLKRITSRKKMTFEMLRDVLLVAEGV